MKKLTFALILTVLATALTACGGDTGNTDTYTRPTTPTGVTSPDTRPTDAPATLPATEAPTSATEGTTAPTGTSQPAEQSRTNRS